jgi:hypothetical protein
VSTLQARWPNLGQSEPVPAVVVASEVSEKVDNSNSPEFQIDFGNHLFDWTKLPDLGKASPIFLL